MKFSWKNIENWWSWKMRFFWGGHFEFSKSAILNFFLLHLCEKSSPFIWGIIFLCTMDGFFRILKKTSFQLFCIRLYVAFDRPSYCLYFHSSVYWSLCMIIFFQILSVIIWCLDSYFTISIVRSNVGIVFNTYNYPITN